ncbi:MAG: hypothetical protein WCS96_05285 [Victivallales bacterium]|jgi:hypothetical protein
MKKCRDKAFSRNISAPNLLFLFGMSALFCIFFASPLNAEVFVYKWSLGGTEYYAPTAVAPKTPYTASQIGYLAFQYDAVSGIFSSEKLVKYWQSPVDKVKYYTNEDFLFGIADFQKIQAASSEYLTISAFWGGMLGEYYSGKTTLLATSKTGAPSPIQMATVLSGWSSWDKTFTDGSTSQGGGTVSLSIDYVWTSYANQNGLTSEQVSTLIVAQIGGLGYDHQGLPAVMDTPAKGTVDIGGGTIDGTVIGGQNPADGTLLNLQTGYAGTNGKLTIHSGGTGFNSVFQTSPTMTGDTLFVLPPDNGSSGQVLTTDGNGILSWTDKGAGGSATASNIGTMGFGVFDNKNGNDLQFRNIAAASDMVTVALNSANISVGIDETNFQAAVMRNPNIQLSKLDATVPPTKDDDANAGYSVGSKWIDTAHGRNYLCMAATAGAAVWQLNTANLSSGSVSSGGSYVNTNNSSWSSK